MKRALHINPFFVRRGNVEIRFVDVHISTRRRALKPAMRSRGAVAEAGRPSIRVCGDAIAITRSMSFASVGRRYLLCDRRRDLEKERARHTVRGARAAPQAAPAAQAT